MAESVDALVSNTSGAIHPGSIPGLGTKQAAKRLMFNRFAFFVVNELAILRFCWIDFFIFLLHFVWLYPKKNLPLRSQRHTKALLLCKIGGGQIIDNQHFIIYNILIFLEK